MLAADVTGDGKADLSCRTTTAGCTRTSRPAMSPTRSGRCGFQAG